MCRSATSWAKVRLFGVCVFILVLCGVRLHGAAPDSVAGEVLRISTRNNAARTITETSYILGVDGTFLLLKSVFTDSSRSRVIQSNLPVESLSGTFSYTKTGESTAKFLLVDSAGQSRTFGLSFPGGVVDGSSTFLFTTLQIEAPKRVLSSPNISLRGNATVGQPLIAGFVLSGASQEVLIRVVGPSLSQFGIAGAWSSPYYSLGSGGQLSAGGHPWGSRAIQGISEEAGLRRVFDYVGAFPLISGSRDAVNIHLLAAGSYSIVCEPGAGDPGGTVLIEMWVLP